MSELLPSADMSSEAVVASETVVAGRRELLARPALRSFLAAQCLGQVADAITSITLAQVVVFEIEHGASPGALARVLVATALPFALSGPIAGIANDRWERRRVLAGANLVRAALTVLAVAVPLTGNRAVGYVTIIALLGAARIVYTGRAAALPHLSEPDTLVTIDSLSIIIGMVASTLGGGIGALLGTRLPEIALVLAACGQAAAAIAFTRLTVSLGGGEPSAQPDRRDMIRHIARLALAAPTRFAIITTSGHRFLLGAGFATFVLLADSRYHFGASGYAVALGCTSAGAFLGSFTAPPVAARMTQVGLATSSYALAAVALVPVVIARNAIVVIGALTVVSFAFQNLRVVSDASVQSTIADDSVGRVFSAYDVIYNLAFVGGAFAGVGVHAGASPEAIFLSLVTGYALGALALSAYARLPLRSRT